MGARPSGAVCAGSWMAVVISERASRATVHAVLVPEQIICVECQGTCHLLSQRPDDDPFMPGDFVAYRCPDCLERFDLVLEADDDDSGI